MVTTDYINTIPPEQEPWFPGDEYIERRIRAFIRWNAVAMVDRANHRFDGLGGHLSTYASAAALYEVGFNHFFRGKADGGFGDQVFFQGHAAPGIYARAFLEGRLTEEQLDRFRREVDGDGLPSYPHPRRMPDVLGVPDRVDGPRPAQRGRTRPASTATCCNRELVDTSDGAGVVLRRRRRDGRARGDGRRCRLAAREQLDNLIFVVNCNLQRLDGPVRGNGKVIQELESTFRGVGWNVIKVIWGRAVGRAARPRRRRRARQQDEHAPSTASSRSTRSRSGAYIREHFFGPDPRLRKMVEHLTDDELRKLPRGGHDYRKLYAAYKTAVEHEGTPDGRSSPRR